MDIQFNPTDKITVDVPLFIRLLEYAREDAKTDMDLHKITENILALSKTGKLLTMDQYDGIVRDSDNTDRPSVNDQINNAKLQSPQEPINENKPINKNKIMKKQLNEIKRIQQLAGIINESQLDKGMTEENIISILKTYENPNSPFYKTNFADYIEDLNSEDYEGMSLSDMNSEEDVIEDYKEWKDSGF
jgi:hypothetical protein